MFEIESKNPTRSPLLPRRPPSNSTSPMPSSMLDLLLVRLLVPANSKSVTPPSAGSPPRAIKLFMMSKLAAFTLVSLVASRRISTTSLPTSFVHLASAPSVKSSPSSSSQWVMSMPWSPTSNSPLAPKRSLKSRVSTVFLPLKK